MVIKDYTVGMILDSPFRLFAALALFFVLTCSEAKAQGEHSVPLRATQQPLSEQQSLPPEPDSEITILRDDFAGKYNQSTLENLAKLYWRLGAFDFEDTEAIGNYLKIVECKLYTEYINDDLEWREIVRTMKDHLVRHRESFPINFQFVLQLHLGRYDSEQGGFPLVDKTGFKNAKRIEVDSIDRSDGICYDFNPIKDYPKNVITVLQTPFTLDFVKLDEHVAQAYILRKKSEFSALPEERRVSSYERDAYLRLRVTFSQYHGNMRGELGALVSILHGRIDGYEIFEDVSQKRLMASVNLDTAQNVTMTIPEMSVPAPVPKAMPVPTAVSP